MIALVLFVLAVAAVVCVLTDRPWPALALLLLIVVLFLAYGNDLPRLESGR